MNKKNVTFINLINNSDENNFSKQLNYIKKSGLYDKLDYIFILLFGIHCKFVSDYKIKEIYYSTDINEGEIPKKNRIKYFLDNVPFNVNILEIDFATLLVNIEK